jgi:hypothetical protein
MGAMSPITDIDPRYSQPGATATPWSQGLELLETALTYWMTTVRPDGRPHVTTVAGVIIDGEAYVTTGPTERKARNLEHATACVLTTGCNGFDGLDVVVEAWAIRVTDQPTLVRVRDAYVAKYGEIFRFEVQGDRLHSGDGGDAYAFRLRARTAFGFAKGEPFSQTRWRFPADPLDDARSAE